MFSTRKRQRGAWGNIKVLAAYNQAAQMTYRGNKLSPAQIAFLSAVHLETLRTNNFCRLSMALGMIGKNLVGWTGIKKMVDLRLLQAPIYGMYCVTVEGEYYLRTIEIFLARIVHDLPLSKWKKMEKADRRFEWVRTPTKP